MGPRQGSPAAEPHKVDKRAFLPSGLFDRPGRTAYFFILLALCFLGAGSAQPVHGASDQITQSITVVVVKPSLSFSDDNPQDSLRFESNQAGSESNLQTVHYQVKTNTSSPTAFNGVISAKVEGGVPGIQLKADPGPFSNQGTAGNVVLRESRTGFLTIGTSQPVPLADKGVTVGPQGTVINGSLPVTWKAVAKEKLPPGDYPVVVTLSIKES